MVDLGFKDYAINFMLAGLFIVCFFAFATRFSTDQGNGSDVINNDYVDFSSLEREINETNDKAEAWSNSFKSDNLFVASGTIVLFSIWGVIKLIWSSVTTFFSLIFDSASTVLGIPPMVLGVISAILLISLIFAGWRVVKRGD